MLFASQPSLFFFFIILTIGLLTSLTDFRQKKIFNIHLILGAAFGLIAVCVTFLIEPKVSISHFANGFLACICGWLLYHFNLWRGGDAKLFVLYAFLMPPSEHSTVLFFSTISLFACSFVIGTVIFTPVFIKDIFLNYRSITSNFLKKREAILEAVTTSIIFSWLLFPLYYIARITNPVFILTISYLLFIWGYDADERKDNIIFFIRKKYPQLCVTILIGFLLRLWLAPNSLSWPVLTYSFLKSGIYAILSSFIHTALNHLKEYRDRVPFAPLLFIGCLLSYTPFLAWITTLIMVR